MKKILPTLIIFIIACFVINTPRKDQRNFNEIFQEEINYANTIFEVLECPVINVDNRSIAEIAMLIQEKN